VLWYVDSSIILRAIKDDSKAANEWMSTTTGEFVASKLVEGEVRCILRNAGLDVSLADPYLDDFWFLPVTDEIIKSAWELDVVLKTADSIHLASALTISPDRVTVVTHDDAMKRAALHLGFRVTDPVTDDPLRT